ncbi:hypothetical protein L218DRAFT_987432 [Marasmius fiardii PR-910]|nr:hypothetical protein L218DRAFT_987432 [Marasmius fiardii PR-910]
MTAEFVTHGSVALNVSRILEVQIGGNSIERERHKQALGLVGQGMFGGFGAGKKIHQLSPLYFKSVQFRKEAQKKEIVDRWMTAVDAIRGEKTEDREETLSTNSETSRASPNAVQMGGTRPVTRTGDDVQNNLRTSQELEEGAESEVTRHWTTGDGRWP